MAINYRQCPNCGSGNVQKIIYGMPNTEIFQRAEGQIKLSGCSILENGPEYYCVECEQEWNKEQAIEAAYARIKGVKASVGGFFGGHSHVEIEFTSGTVTWEHYEQGEKVDSDKKTVKENAMQNFKNDLKKVQLLDWRADYPNPGIMDGTQWEVELVRDGKNLKKHGDNQFPDEWEDFNKAVRRVTGRDFL
ncbi:hypothetical protein [Sediminibacillus massiliensis]|uniref:hypothetical protein n=1 Tax=Sediminibacillus massiliensis TaxID=1926277 RepID=UPI000988771F|nr:hypothetical protein [Sediminibacillus massiliensis]